MSDPTSLANTLSVISKHLKLIWNVDFNRKIITGSVEHSMLCLKETNEIILDTSNLVIKSCKVNLQNVNFKLSDATMKFGSSLVISYKCMAEQAFKLQIEYETTPKSSALQWLEPSQTVGKVKPYLFSQCQAIHARSLVPCQDSPGVKITYEAQVTVPPGLTALMSAIRKVDQNHENTFFFQQPTSIPSYLIALAVGNLKGISVGPRSTVWSEPEVVDAAAWEFAETEQFIKTGEELLTPYEWGVYDLLLLPSSFPYGGMENPCLTFVTPTLLAGDRSLVDVVAHEIAHSWMGNLVTTMNWEHFWLNEGFTVFVERKIAGRLYGQENAGFSAMIGYRHLEESVEHMNKIGHPEYTCLCPKLVGVDPDDVFSSVPYEKGYNFLVYLENLLGGPKVFEPYLKAHVTKFAHKSITTTDFKDCLFDYFSKIEGKLQLLQQVDWDAWFFQPGMPIVENKFDESLAEASKKLAETLDLNRNTVDDSKFGVAEFNNFTSGQKVMLFEKLRLKDAFSTAFLARMEELYNLKSTKNAEINFSWFMLCLKSNFKQVIPQVVSFVTNTGRMKFVRPIYRELKNCDEALAKKVFLENRSFYHPICATMVSKDLGL